MAAAHPAVELPEADGAVLDARLLSLFRAHSFVKVRARLPWTTSLYKEMGRVFNQPPGTKAAYAMPDGVQTGVRGVRLITQGRPGQAGGSRGRGAGAGGGGRPQHLSATQRAVRLQGAEYCNAGYLNLEADKEYMSMRRARAGHALPSTAADASVAASGWRARQFEEVSIQAQSELEALGKRVLDCFEAALAAEVDQQHPRGYLSSLMDYPETPEDLEPGREVEDSNVTLSMLRYQRNASRDSATETAATDSGEVNAAIQQPGTGLPCAAHTDASMITLITAPSQLGLEVFDIAHPNERSVHATALAAHELGQQPDGRAAAGADSEGGLWVPGFAEHELTKNVQVRRTPVTIGRSFS